MDQYNHNITESRLKSADKHEGKQQNKLFLWLSKIAIWSFLALILIGIIYFYTIVT